MNNVDNVKIQQIFRSILTSKVYDVAQRTPLTFATKLSSQYHNNVYLKREDLQKNFSFKIRGAYNKIAHLSSSEYQKGIVCASAGNHAQGVALASKTLNIPVTVVMPTISPDIKIKAVQQLGAEVILYGNTVAESLQYCKNYAREQELAFIHPFDDVDIIAGHGTIGMECMQDLSQIDYIFVPVGGGGLISGIALYVKELSPQTQIIGVEPDDCNSMIRSLQNNKIIPLDKIGIFADGVAVKEVGEITFQICQQKVDDWVTVSTDEICSAMKNIFEDTRTLVEPSGAVSLAGFIKYAQKKQIQSKNIITINSGANVNFDRMRFVAERAKVGEGKEMFFVIYLKEHPGTLKKLCQEILGEVLITEFCYRYSHNSKAVIFLGIEVSHISKKHKIFHTLEKFHYKHQDLTDNELAKSHVRYMVGGKQNLLNERVFQFYFPERTNALYNFLSKMESHWNVSMFHYRNYGSDFGRVLLGMQVPQDENQQLTSFLSALQYDYVEETHNNAYKLFLQ